MGGWKYEFGESTELEEAVVNYKGGVLCSGRDKGTCFSGFEVVEAFSVDDVGTIPDYEYVWLCCSH